MNRTRTLAVSATLTAAAALGIFFATGTMPPAEEGAICTVSWAAGPCEVAQLLAAYPLGCTPGTYVTLPVEIATTQSEPDDEAHALPSVFVPIEGTTREVPCSTFDNPSERLGVARLDKYGVNRGGVFCPPIVVAGLVPPGCE